MTNESTLTAERLRELLTYDPETGVFRRRIATSNSIRVGDVAGGVVSALGYHRISIDNRRYWSHRLAWLYVHGEWPAEIDHRNGDKADNRLVNLREATQAQNMQNIRRPRSDNTSGYRGVTWHPRAHRWCAKIQVDRKSIHLGLFDTPEEAHGAYLAAKLDVHPFWAAR